MSEYNLIRGKTYLIESNDVMLYLGTDNKKYYFYLIGKLAGLGRSRPKRVVHLEEQIKYITDLGKCLMGQALHEDAIVRINVIKIQTEITSLDFSKEIELYYINNMVANPRLPKLE